MEQLPYQVFAAGGSQPIGATRLWDAAIMLLKCYPEWVMVDGSPDESDAKTWPKQGTDWNGLVGREFSPDGFRVWNFTDNVNTLLFYIVRVADGMTGLCSRHRFGEDPSCETCFAPDDTVISQ